MATTNPSVFKGFNSFSGTDIKAVFNNKVMANLQAISYSVTREKAPLYTMGAADPRSFSRGKRGIAGTLIFVMFDKHALLDTFGIFADTADRLTFQSDKDDHPPVVGDREFNSDTPLSSLGLGDVTLAEDTLMENIGSDQNPNAAAWFVDQIPPFDITLAAANEYGRLAVMRIYGVEILNEGYGVSIDDIVSEQQMTYVARTLVGWRPVEQADATTSLAATTTEA
jgi:hypothetical protein